MSGFNRFVLLAIVSSCGVAQAQLNYDGVTYGAAEESNCNTTFGTRLGGFQSFGTSGWIAGKISLKGHTNVQLQRSATTWSQSTTTYLSFSVGNTPVELSYPPANNYSTNGKIVVGGGPFGAAIPTTASRSLALSISEYIDDDNSGAYSDGDTVFPLRERTVHTSATQVGNGFFVYNVEDGIVSSAVDYVLAANRKYVWGVTVTLEGTLNSNNTEPYYVISHEFNGDFRGHDFAFTYRTVPTPASVALMGVSSLLLSRRRR